MGGKIDKQKRVIEKMIMIYCLRHEGNRQLCNECKEMLMYASQRLDNCRYGEIKKSCKMCETHCYKKDMRDKIRKVMKFSGPRMIIYGPIEAIRHLWEERFSRIRK